MSASPTTVKINHVKDRYTNPRLTHSPSVAARIPPELFDSIVSFIGDRSSLSFVWTGDTVQHQNRLRKREMRHLSACALTCVRWANLTRPLMYNKLILRSPEDLRLLKRLVRVPPSPRIGSIGNYLEGLLVFYQLDRYPWFSDIQALRACGATRLFRVILCISGPYPPPLSPAHTDRDSPIVRRHPLFRFSPRTLPISFPQDIRVFITLKDIHLPNHLTLLNLLRDLDAIVSFEFSCEGVTWDGWRGTSLPTPLAFSAIYPPSVTVKECTDDIFIIAGLQDRIRRRDLLGRERGMTPLLGVADTLQITNIMRVIHTRDEPTEDEEDDRGSADWTVWGGVHWQSSDPAAYRWFPEVLCNSHTSSSYLYVHCKPIYRGLSRALTIFTDPFSHNADVNAVPLLGIFVEMLNARDLGDSNMMLLDILDIANNLPSLEYIALGCYSREQLAVVLTASLNTLTSLRNKLRFFHRNPAYSGGGSQLDTTASSLSFWSEVHFDDLVRTTQNTGRVSLSPIP